MISTIDQFTSLTGWSGSGGGSAHGVNALPEFVAGLNSTSAIFKFATGSLSGYVKKAVSINLDSYDEIVFHIWSRNKKNLGSRYLDEAEFPYSIEFYKAMVKVGMRYIPTGEGFQNIVVDCSGIGTIDEMRIVCKHSVEDYIILSHMVAVRDEIPRDIFQAIKEQLEYDFGLKYAKVTGGVADKGILIGTITGTAGDTSIVFSSPVKFTEKYSVIMIVDLVNSEVHQINENDELEFFFNSTYDGKALLHSYTGANVYLTIPVEFGRAEDEILLPGVAIWGMNPEEIYDITKLDSVRDSFKDDGSVSERKGDAKYRYQIMIDCEARHNEMIAFMSLIVRYFIARQYLWLNGRKTEIFSDGTSTFIEPVEGYNEIPKIQYLVQVDIKEQVFNRERLDKTLSRIVSYVFEEN